MKIKATISTSGSQLRVAQGDVVVVDRVGEEAGSTLKFGEVLMVEKGDDVAIGQPHVADASVEAEVIEHFRGKKVRVFKMKRRKKYRLTKGHRSELSRLRITAINHGG